MPKISFVDLKPYRIMDLPFPSCNLIYYLDQQPNFFSNKVSQTESLYKYTPDAILLGIKVSNEIVGILGMLINKEIAVIKHFGILSEYKSKNLISQILESIHTRYNLRILNVSLYPKTYFDN